MRLFVCFSIVICVFGITPFSVLSETILKFGVYTADKPTVVIKQFRPVIKLLEQKLSKSLGESLKIEFLVSKSYLEGINYLVEGYVDFSRFGPASYIEAKKRNPQISILAIEHKKSKKVFNGVICVQQDSPIQKIEEVKNKKFAFGDQRSTIGRFLSQLYLLKHKIKSSDLKFYEYLGRHDKVGNAVARGKFDAGALKESTFRRLIKEGKKLRLLAKFPNVTKPWIAGSAMPEKMKTALKVTLLSIKDKNALKALKKDGFLEGHDDDYAVIRQAIEMNPVFFN